MNHRQFDGVLPTDRILAGDASDDYSHDETLGGAPVIPMAVLLPETASEVAAILRLCDERLIVVTRAVVARVVGRGDPERWWSRRVVRAYEAHRDRHQNQVAIVEPGVTLAELDEATAKHDLVYPVIRANTPRHSVATWRRTQAVCEP